jgi:uncharacterized surface protein with fasciclin (FAS1) repeats
MRKKVITAVLAAALLTPVGAASADGGASGSTSTLADVLLADGNQFDWNPFDYDIVTEAVLLFPALVDAASNPDAELTVFLPNDWAFRRLVADLTGEWPLRESEVFGAVAALGTDTVGTVLQYHIVAGPPISYRAATQSDGAVLTTLQGGQLTVDVTGRWWKRVRLIDADPDARDATVVHPDVGGAAANGFAHGVDRVLRPVAL